MNYSDYTDEELKELKEFSDTGEDSSDWHVPNNDEVCLANLGY